MWYPYPTYERRKGQLMVLVSLNLQNKRIVIVGGGVVATRKLSTLLKQDADILIISPDITDTIQAWIDNGKLDCLQERYHSDSLFSYKPNLVFAATDNADLNKTIADDARKIGAWVNIASDSEKSDFHSLASVEKDPIRIGISTSGTSPALIKIIKQGIEQTISDDILQLAQWLADIRPLAKAKIPSQSERQDLFRQIVNSNILDLLKKGKIDSAKERFETLTKGLS